MEFTKLALEIFDRAPERLIESLDQMSVAEANTMPAPLIKSVTWLVWHTAREIDLQISDLKQTEPIWISEGWNKKFALDLPDDTEDWRHTPEEAAKVVVKDKQLVKDYLIASMKLATDYIQSLDEARLNDIVDKRWTPAVTRQARVVSIIDDAVMHSGQAVYTRRLVIGK